MKKQNALIAVALVVVAAIFILTTSSFTAPQSKGYEYVTISQLGTATLLVAKSGETLYREKLDMPKAEMDALNTKPLLDKITEFEKQGWELVEITHVTAVTYVHLADLRRPIP